jgi:hypothetical protein
MLEILSRKLSKEKKIKYIQIAKKKVKFSLFLDDTLYKDNPKKSTENL